MLEKCPESFPYPFDDGKKCCRSLMKESDTGLAADCDGDKIKGTSSKECCWKQLYVDCSDQTLGCNKAAGKPK